MTKMTSAYANKVIRKLEEDKEYFRKKEVEGHVYVASIDEEPVIPEYDFSEVSKEIEEIDNKVVKIKHAINWNNATNHIQVGNTQMTIDEILIRMAQLGKRKLVLDHFRKLSPKSRVSSGLYSARKAAPEYQYINFDMDLVKAEYERIDGEIATMQIALDKYNQTFEFEVDI